MRERALQFGDAGNLVGVVSEPSPDGPDGLPGVILLNAGILHRVGPSRMNVKIARALAERGFTCLRFDFSGIGDSGARPDRLPFDESSALEIAEAMDHLQEARDIDEFILVGLCSGADAAYNGALADSRVTGIVPLDGYAYPTWRFWALRYLPRLFRWKSWKNVLSGKTYVGPWIRKRLGRGRPDETGRRRSGAEGRQVFQRPRPPQEKVETGLRTLVERQVEMLMIFSGELEDRYNHHRQFRDAFDSVDFRDLLRVEYFAEADHTFTDLDLLEQLVDTIVGWAGGTWPRKDRASALSRSPEERAA